MAENTMEDWKMNFDGSKFVAEVMLKSLDRPARKDWDVQDAKMTRDCLPEGLSYPGLGICGSGFRNGEVATRTAFDAMGLLTTEITAFSIVTVPLPETNPSILLIHSDTALAPWRVLTSFYTLWRKFCLVIE